MSGFSAAWLALREPADAAARSPEAAACVADWLAPRSPIRIVDLGAGTGSNGRWLSPFLPRPQHWRLVDHDAALLEVAQDRVPFDLETRVHDLHALEGSVLAGADLVTASALLDLVSERWLGELVQHCASIDAAVLFALNYDGRVTCTPPDEDDELVRRLVNEHQRTDKGFGTALGPAATGRIASLLEEAGYRVGVYPSDWVLGADDSQLQRELIEGWSAAASDMSPHISMRIEAWRRRRLAHVDAGQSEIAVGHQDVAGTPAALGGRRIR